MSEKANDHNDTKTEDNQNGNTKEINSGIHLRLVPSTPYLLEGVENKLYLLLEIRADEVATKLERSPYNLAMVLDRSGSMQGEKIVYAKKAASLILDNIHKEDILHLVMYDDVIDRVFTNGNIDQKERLKREIEKITARNSTNLAGGLLEGQKILDEFRGKTHSKRIFLFSDGLANVGITSEDQIFALTRQMHEQGINTTSFGIGKDFHEMMMTGIAEYGRGDYFFIENADSIPHIVEEAIQGLLETVASNVTLRIRGLEGAIVNKIYLHDVMKGVTLGDLRSGETRRIIAEISINPTKIVKNDLVSVELEYRLADDLTNVKTFRDKVSILTTSEESKLIENEEVMAYKIQNEAAESELKVYEFLEKHQFDQAMELNQSLIGKLQSTSFRDKEGMIADKLDNLEDMNKYIDQAKKTQDSRAAMKRSSYSYYQSKSSKLRGFKEKFREEE